MTILLTILHDRFFWGIWAGLFGGNALGLSKLPTAIAYAGLFGSAIASAILTH